MIKKLWFFALIQCAFGLDAYVLSGLVLPISKSLHTAPESIGLGIAFFTIAYALSTPVIGKYFRLIHTKFILQIALVIFILGNIITIYANSLEFFLVSRLFAGIGAGLFSPIAFAIAVQLSTKENRGSAISIVLAGLSIGTALGVPVGLWLAKVYTWKFTIIVIILLSAIGLIILYLKRALIPLVENNNSFFTKNMISHKTISILAITFFTGFASLGLYSYLPELLVAQKFPSFIIYAMWLWGIGGCIGAFSIGKLLDTFVSNRSLTISISLTIIVSFVFIFLGNINLILFSCFLWGYAGWSSIVPQQHTLTSIPEVSHRDILALNASLNYLGGAIGTMFSSWIVHMHKLVYLPLILTPILMYNLYLRYLYKD